MILTLAVLGVTIASIVISRLLKIIGLFAEYRLFHRALFKKRPIIFYAYFAMGRLRVTIDAIVISRLLKIIRSLLQKSPIKQTIFCKRDLDMYWAKLLRAQQA